MKEPTTAILLGRLQQALKLLGSLRKAATDVGAPYSSAWRMLKGLEQPQGPRPRRHGSLSAQDDMAAYDLLGEHTAASAAIQLYRDGSLPKALREKWITSFGLLGFELWHPRAWRDSGDIVGTGSVWEKCELL